MLSATIDTLSVISHVITATVLSARLTWCHKLKVTSCRVELKESSQRLFI